MAAESAQALLSRLCERDWQAQVVVWLKRGSWQHYHTYESRRSNPGFPDLICIHRERKLLLAVELKSESGRLTKQQQAWLDAFASVGAVTHVWRPSMFREIRAFLCEQSAGHRIAAPRNDEGDGLEPVQKETRRSDNRRAQVSASARFPISSGTETCSKYTSILPDRRVGVKE